MMTSQRAGITNGVVAVEGETLTASAFALFCVVEPGGAQQLRGDKRVVNEVGDLDSKCQGSRENECGLSVFCSDAIGGASVVIGP